VSVKPYSDFFGFEFTLSFSKIFIGSFDIRALQEVFSTEVSNPEISIYLLKSHHVCA